MCLGPEAGRNRLVRPECREQDAAVLRWTVSDHISVFPATCCKEQHVETRTVALDDPKNKSREVREGHVLEVQVREITA